MARAKTVRSRRVLAILLAFFFIAGAVPARGGDDNGFVVNIVLSPKADSTLARRREAMVIMVSYYGWPKPSAQGYGDEVGQIGFGTDHVIAIPGRAGQYRVPSAKFDRRRLDWVDGPVMVNVNIASVRKRDPDNLLDCESIDKPLAEIHKMPSALHCKLIRDDP